MSINASRSTLVTDTVAESAPTSPLVCFNEAVAIPLKLTPTNYPLWRAQLRSVLIGNDLFRFLDGSYPCPASEATNSTSSTRTLWIRQDQLILNAILATITEQILPFIASSLTSAQAWNTLEMMYAGRSRSRIMQLKAQLASLRKGSLHTLDYLQQIRNICDELALIDRPIHEEDQVVYVLNGLGTSYREFATSIKARESPITFVELQARLLDYDEDLLRNSTASTSLPLA